MDVDAQHGHLVSVTRAFVDGEPASEAALIRFARSSYGHYTTMQVRAGAVRGLSLHLARLEHATHHLFDITLDLSIVRRHMRMALAEHSDASLRISIGARNYSARAMPLPAQIETLLLVDPPASARSTPMRLSTFRHVRHLPQLKHCGNFDMFELRWQALAHGFDDALLLTPDDHIAEGPTFNVGFFQGDELIWPQALLLEGTTLRLLRQAHEDQGGRNTVRPIGLNEIGNLDGGFCCHSGGIWSIATINQQALPTNADGMARLNRLWTDIPGELI